MGVRIFGIAGSSNPAEDFRLAASGIFVPASTLNNRTGVTSTPTLTGTGSLTCQINPFSCLIDGTSNSLQGSYWATLDSATTVTITAGVSQVRIDLISLQILDNAYDGSGQQKGQIVYTAGTAGSGSAPSTPANAIPLFTVTVPVNATTLTFSTAATAVFPYTTAAGGIVPVRSASDKPAAAAGVQYRHRLDVVAGTGAAPLEWSTDGVTYTPVYDPAAAYGAWTNLSMTASFTSSGGNIAQWRTAPGGRFEFRGVVTTTATTSVGLSIWNGGPVPSVNRRVAAAPKSGNAIGIDIFTSGAGSLSLDSAGSSYASGTSFYLDGCWCSA